MEGDFLEGSLHIFRYRASLERGKASLTGVVSFQGVSH